MADRLAARLARALQASVAGEPVPPQDIGLAVAVAGRPAVGGGGSQILALQVLKTRPASDEVAWGAVQRLVASALGSPEEARLCVGALHTPRK